MVNNTHFGIISNLFCFKNGCLITSLNMWVEKSVYSIQTPTRWLPAVFRQILPEDGVVDVATSVESERWLQCNHCADVT